MLTVRYDWLGVRPGDRLLDLGCGLGRHAFEAARRGGLVVALDASDRELKEVRNTFAAMAAAGEIDETTFIGVTNGDATALPFASGAFDRIIAAEVLEHIPNDHAALTELFRVLAPGGTIAITVPAWFPERLNWFLSDQYHAPHVPGGHVRIYREWELRDRMRAAGFRPRGAHHAHALHSPYWWLRCIVGPANDAHFAVKAYRRFLEWDIVNTPRPTRIAERLLNPMLGKSLVVYARKEGATS